MLAQFRRPGPIQVRATTKTRLYRALGSLLVVLALAGTCPAACTVCASLLGKSPVGNACTAGLRADVAAHLQQVAWDTAHEHGAS
jgi:hypothetical protein